MDRHITLQAGQLGLVALVSGEPTAPTPAVAARAGVAVSGLRQLTAYAQGLGQTRQPVVTQDICRRSTASAGVSHPLQGSEAVSRLSRRTGPPGQAHAAFVAGFRKPAVAQRFSLAQSTGTGQRSHAVYPLRLPRGFSSGPEPCHTRGECHPRTDTLVPFARPRPRPRLSVGSYSPLAVRYARGNPHFWDQMRPG